MKERLFFKAHPSPREIPDVRIEVTEVVPELTELSAQSKLYTTQGNALAKLLYETLPGGTMDALISALLKKRASMFRVTFEDNDKTGE